MTIANCCRTCRRCRYQPANAVQTTAEGAGFSVVREYVGHGIGRALHEDPPVPNYGSHGKGLPLEPGLVIVCGRYEGIDDRVRAALQAREISIGDYVLTGGEIPAMVLVDAVARLIPGVVGDPGSLAQDSFADELTGWPQFTRPAEYRGMTVPDVLLSGDHARIKQWRRQQAAQRRVPRGKELKKT